MRKLIVLLLVIASFISYSQVSPYGTKIRNNFYHVKGSDTTWFQLDGSFAQWYSTDPIKINEVLIVDTIEAVNVKTDMLHPNDSASISLCNHNNSSLLWLGNGVQKMGSLNAYFTAFKGVDLSMNNYYKDSKWYRTLDGNATCAFQNYDNSKFEWYFAGHGLAGSEITWSTAETSLDSTGNYTTPVITAVDSFNVGGSDYVGSIIDIADIEVLSVQGISASAVIEGKNRFSNTMKAASFTATAEEVMNGATFLINSTAAEVVITLPLVSTLTMDSIIKTFNIIHGMGDNNIKIQCSGSDTMIYGNTFVNLGAARGQFIIASRSSTSLKSYLLFRNFTVKASAHRDATWNASNFSSTTIIPWDAEPYNSQDEILDYTAGASARYTIETTGTYKVNYTIDINSTGGATWNATSWIYKNGVVLENTEVRSGNYGNEDQSMTLPCSYIDLEAGDYIDVRIDQNNLTGTINHHMFNIEIRL